MYVAGLARSPLAPEAWRQAQAMSVEAAPVTEARACSMALEQVRRVRAAEWLLRWFRQVRR
jgi:hypothetical protein